MKTSGILYFLVNKSMPGLVKIGYTTKKLRDRLQQLNTTGIPSPFLTSSLFYVKNAKDCEREVHQQLEKYRKNPNREFFSQTVSVLIQESIGVIGKYIESSEPVSLFQREESVQFEPDKDDIYFMFYLLHDSYENNIPYSATELSQHHSNYAPLELELKFINLEKHGFVKRVNREHEGMGMWQILPKGVKFMFDSNNHAQDLIEEAKNNATEL